MKAFRELFRGMLLAGLLMLIVAGTLMLSLVEGTTKPSVETLPSEIAIDFPTGLPIQKTPAQVYNIPSVTATIACTVPLGWHEYIVQVGDTLADLATNMGVTQEELREANCLLSNELVAGTLLFLPPIQATLTNTPAPTQTPAQCGPPFGWVRYRIQAHDTLFRISLDYGVSVPQLQFANCMGNSTFLRTGDYIFVPNVATRTPDFSPTPTGTKSPTLTSTPETETVEPTATTDPIPTVTNAGYPAP